jgi:dolichyl-phosphate-mannose-protein mannosyltransferase
VKRLITSIVGVIIMLSLTPAFADTANLVQNPGFEQGSPTVAYSWSENIWDKTRGSQIVIDNLEKHSEQRSIKIVNSSPNDTRYEQTINVKENTNYRLSCWVKTENVGSGSKGANISVYGIPDTSGDITGTSEGWQQIEMYGKTGKDQKQIGLTVGVGGHGSINSGTAWFDDVKVEEVSKVPEGKKIADLFVTGTTGSQSGKGPSTALIAIPALLFVFVIVLLIMMLKFRRPKTVSNQGAKQNVAAVLPKHEITKLTIGKKDIMIMGAMTLIYLIIALINLGSFRVPDTGWKPGNAGESFVVDLGKTTNVSRFYYYDGHSTNDAAYRVEYKDSKGTFKPLTSFTKKSGDFFTWLHVDANANTNQIKIIADAPGGTINEIGVFEQGSQKPLTGLKIIDKNVSSADVGSVENLIDEQDIVEYNPTFMSNTYFDEIYFVRTAYEHMHGIDPFEWTHPPLGKLIIAFGIIIFGMDPFGWRIIGTLVGAAMIPLMYLFGKKLFGKKFYGFCAAFLMMFDFMHFSQTRIGTGDMYVSFFVILMYYYMYDYYANKSYVLGFKRSLKPLLLSGIFFGLAASTKWVGLYGAPGLALMFIIAKVGEIKDYSKLLNKKSKKPAWMNDFIPLNVFATIILCVLFFIIIPGAIYLASYIPYMRSGGGHSLGDVINLQSQMYGYHHDLVATHPSECPWWAWPIIRMPVWFYSGGSGNKVSTIVSIGNPAIWWTGIVTFLASIIIAIKKHDKKIAFIFIAAASQYLPWMLVPRITFLYHYFSILPFVMLSIVYVIKTLCDKYPEARNIVYIYFAIVALLFIFYYPVLAGVNVSQGYIHGLKLFKDWVGFY